MTIKIIDNCCSPVYLEYLKQVASYAENWNLHYPLNTSIEDKFPKLDIIQKGTHKHSFLAGLAMGLLLQIYKVSIYANDGQELFIPEIYWCGISIKDKHRLDNIHADTEEGEGAVKILGIINNDWKEEWGGGFFHDGTSNYIKPTSFCIFDPTKPHSAEEIFTDKKRMAIDFTVFRDQQSLDKRGKIGNK